MNTTELFESLTESQKLEFKKDTQDFIEKMAKSGYIYTDKLHEVNTNVRLENKVFLNVTFQFIATEGGIVRGIISNIHKFDDINQYLDSINEAKNRGNEWTSIK